LRLCSDDPDRLAAAVAHEIAHALLDHAAEDLTPDHAEDLMLAVPAFVMATTLPKEWAAKDRAFRYLFARCFNLLAIGPYSQHMEREADRVGTFLASCACADPVAAFNFWMDVLATDDVSAAHSYFAMHTRDPDQPRWFREVLVPLAEETRQKHHCGSRTMADD
jgi:predicted Zn-dependent protease